MSIRTFQPGDESAQVSIYNEAAGDLPKFKPATLDEVRRRIRDPGFDPKMRFFALDGDQPVGYASFSVNGRVSYPWCRAGHEHHAEGLFQAVLQAMKGVGLKKAFAAYRGDWPAMRDFFLKQGFVQAREMVNFVVDLADLPTPAARPNSLLQTPTAADMAGLFALAPGALRVSSPAELERHLLHNPYFPPDSVFVFHHRTDNTPVAVGVLVVQTGYADPLQIDAGMPCFRLGAFGTETMTWKRVNALFSFLARPGSTLTPYGLDLLGAAATRLETTDLDTIAAQSPSDVPHLLKFYETYFRRQGSFPVYQRMLS
jgi:hypothetical protein